MIVDAHSHVWAVDPLQYPWQPVGGYVPEVARPASELLAAMDAAGVERAVLVQPTPYGWDNAYLLDAFRDHPHRFSAVCLVDPHSPGSPPELERLVKECGVSGVRFNWSLEPGFSWAGDRLHGLIWESAQALGIPVCLQLAGPQLEQAGAMAARYPRLKIVIDHLGRPEPGGLPGDPGFRRFLALAGHSNCYAKLSGLYYFSREAAPYADAWPLLRAVLREFGAQRCLWGSDFPFVLERWGYAEWLAALTERLELSGPDLDWVLGKTALALGW